MVALPGMMPTDADLQALLAAQSPVQLSPADLAAQDAAAQYAQQLASDNSGINPDVAALSVPTAGSFAPELASEGRLAPGDKRSSGQSISVSRAGLTPEGRQIAGNLGALKPRTLAEVDRFNKENQFFQGQFDEAAQQEQAAALGQGEATAGAMEKQAGDTEKSRGSVQKAAQALGLDPNAIQGSGLDIQAAAQEQVLGLEVKAAQQMEADMAKARADFGGALARQEAMQIDPHRIFRNEAIQWSGAIAAVAAVSGKPGNALLSQNFMNTINGAATRDIQAQMENMANQKSVTQGFKQMYDMVAADSASQGELRHKLHAMYLGTVESHVNALALKEQSKVVRAQYQSLAAKINSEKVEAASKAYNDRAGIHASRLANISQDARTAAQVSVERSRIALEQRKLEQTAREFEAGQKAAGAAKVTQVQDEAVFATSPDGGKRYLGQVKGVSDTEKAKNNEKINQIQADSTVAAENLSRILDLNKKLRAAEGQGLFAAATGIRSEIVQELETLKAVTAPMLTSALGMAPVSNEDIEGMKKAIGSEKAQELLTRALGLTETTSETASAQVLDLISRRADATISNYVRPAADQGEINAVRQRYGDKAMFEQGGAFVPLPYVKDGQLSLETTAVPVADEKGQATKKAAGFEAMGDITKYDPNALPGRKREAEGILEPKPDSQVQALQKQAMEYKPKEDTFEFKTQDEAPPAYVKFAKQMDKSGVKTDDGKDYAPRVFGGGVNLPNFADEITELAYIANHSTDEDQRGAAVDVLLSMRNEEGSRGDYAEWALDNPGEFSKKGTGRVVAGVSKDEENIELATRD